MKPTSPIRLNVKSSARASTSPYAARQRSSSPPFPYPSLASPRTECYTASPQQRVALQRLIVLQERKPQNRMQSTPQFKSGRPGYAQCNDAVPPFPAVIKTCQSGELVFNREKQATLKQEPARLRPLSFSKPNQKKRVLQKVLQLTIAEEEQHAEEEQSEESTFVKVLEEQSLSSLLLSQHEEEQTVKKKEEPARTQRLSNKQYLAAVHPQEDRSWAETEKELPDSKAFSRYRFSDLAFKPR